jgi:polysaccharide deacetylase family protein (PEP-CTERM system associated)
MTSSGIDRLADRRRSTTPTAPTSHDVRHFFTVDVEEHFQVSAFEGVVRREDWSHHESRVERNVDLLLDLLARRDTIGTFFVLGCVAQEHPAMVRRIAGAGHEIASHGQDHRRVIHQTPDQFRHSIRQSKVVLEDLVGTAVLGFRAPSFSIVPGRDWAFDVLIEEGYRYDSSLFPIRRSAEYGYPTAPREPHWIRRSSGFLYEYPMTTLQLFGSALPASGGGYFRMFPYAVTRAAFRAATARRVPAVFYIHPWEVDPTQPRIDARLTARLRHYAGLERTAGRLERLLSEFRFGAVAEHLSAVPSPTPSCRV